MGEFLFLFFFVTFLALTLSPLLGTPEIVWRDEGVTFNHICWRPGAPLPLSPPPPPTQPPSRPEIDSKVGGSRRMARWYAPRPRGPRLNRH